MCAEEGEAMRVEDTWDLARLQEEMCRGAAHQYVATINLLKKHAPQAIRDFNIIFIANKTYFKQMIIDTPLDLATALAEAETNVFGGTFAISGSAERASVTYARCAEWVAIEELSNICFDAEVEMAGDFVCAMQELAQEFGFACEVAFSKEGSVVTFSRHAPEA